jgi:hypothetical protein
MLDQDVAHIPEHERHWPSGLCISSFRVVPSISVTVDTPSPVTVDMDPLAADHETCSMVLKGDGIRAVSPVAEVVRELVTGSDQDL